MANIVDGGETRDLRNGELHEIGYATAAYPQPLMAAVMRAMMVTLRGMREGRRENLMDFAELRDRIGFEDCYEASEAYASARRDG